jgi:hypothetical protein
MHELRPQVLIGRESTDHLSIHVLGRLHAGADDFWDGNWLVTPVDLSVGAFRGMVPASLRAEELAAFREQLGLLHESMRGVATLDSMEGWLQLTVSVEASGVLEITGRARDTLGRANELSFHLDGLGLSDLPEIIDALDEVGVFFPVIGQR